MKSLSSSSLMFFFFFSRELLRWSDSSVQSKTDSWIHSLWPPFPKVVLEYSVISFFVLTSQIVDELVIKCSRSSGPGGQNVNKVNSKVDMRLNLSTAVWIPRPVKDRIYLQNQHRINKNNELVLQSDTHRTQMMNYTECVRKLYSVVVEAAVEPEGPSEETVERVEKHKLRQSLRNWREKEHRAATKSFRRKGRGDW